MFVQSGGRQWAFVSQHPIFLLQVHTHTHTLPHQYFLMASVALPRFKDSKTGTIWYSHPASHFLPPPPSPSVRDKKDERRRKEGIEWQKRNWEGMRGSAECGVCLCVLSEEQVAYGQDVAWGCSRTVVIVRWAGACSTHAHHRHFSAFCCNILSLLKFILNVRKHTHPPTHSHLVV